MNILAIDTSTDVASLALWGVDGLIWKKEITSQRTHSSALFPALEEARDKVDVINRIVVGLGPGSYAGVRISIAAALGLQCVWKCELVGMPSVLALAPVGSSFRVVGDARRGAWYFSQIVDGICIDGPRLIENASVLGDVLRGGSSELLSTEILPEPWLSLRRLPDAAILAELAFADSGVSQRDNLEPLYLREPHITVAAPKIGFR